VSTSGAELCELGDWIMTVERAAALEPRNLARGIRGSANGDKHPGGEHQVSALNNYEGSSVKSSVFRRQLGTWNAVSGDVYPIDLNLP
jgi:hypothetical protein